MDVFEILRAFNAGDLETLRARVTPDVSYVIPGRAAVSGEFHGIDGVVGAFQRLRRLSGETIEVEPQLVVHDGGRTRPGTSRTSMCLSATGCAQGPIGALSATGCAGARREQRWIAGYERCAAALIGVERSPSVDPSSCWTMSLGWPGRLCS